MSRLDHLKDEQLCIHNRKTQGSCLSPWTPIKSIVSMKQRSMGCLVPRCLGKNYELSDFMRNCYHYSNFREGSLRETHI